jgi:ATP-dependent exoDNAse (exonuclease V) beta subunit
MRFTGEQAAAIERRQGTLLLDAGAGSGKTSVLVERFARAVMEDGVEVGAILTITFTEKAAAELRERIRARLRALGAGEAARATEGAYISTVHGFCARVLRTHALAAGLDPAFAVLESDDAQELAGHAFDAALADVARSPGGAELIATYGPLPLRSAILSLHAELRSRGQRRPVLPPAGARTAARALAAELGALAEPSVRIVQALDALERTESVLGAPVLWPGELGEIAIPSPGGAAALQTDACDEYREALGALRSVAATGFAVAMRDALDGLLGAYADRYAVAKTERSGVDFEDLELQARELLARPEIGDRYRARFSHVMVDELQDTNRVQWELIDLVAREGGSLFMVGDAQQSIYGFRHAEVELFEARGRALGASGSRASLQTNFRSRPEILAALNAAFSSVLGDAFRPLLPGREDAPAGEPLVEMLIVDKGADWEADGLSAPWRLAEARTLARRVSELIVGGRCAPGDVVVLTRATTDLRAYERALEDAGVPTYVIGGRGYWGHPQVVELVAYLRALANPLDEEALFTVLLSPLGGLSLDGLVLFAAGARDELAAEDAERLGRFEAWFAGERAAGARLGVEPLLDRVLERTGYDRAVLGLPGGRRRLANVRKLMRLGREWEAQAGPDLRGFLGLVEQRAGGDAGGAGGGPAGGRESEAPMESEGLDAVRLMTIHRAKGLEFPLVCVADLGRGPIFRAPLVRIGRDGRSLGLRLGRPGTGERLNALDYDALRTEETQFGEAEERRLFYVAMTRAKERLILTGAAKLDSWEKGNRSTPYDWIVPSFVPGVVDQLGQRSFVTDLGVRVEFVSEDVESETVRSARFVTPSREATVSPPTLLDPLPPDPLPARDAARVASLSYSSLAEYERCGYRFYVERVLGLPPTAERIAPEDPGGMSATERGSVVHELLAALDLHHPQLPPGTPSQLTAVVEAFLAGPMAARLAAADQVQRELPFAFPLGEVLIRGVFDAFAREGERVLVVDYKTGRLAPYAVQRLIYGLAALRLGAPEVEVAHVFLEATGEPVTEMFTAADRDPLEAGLAERAAGPLAGRFPVAPDPHRGLCWGCPAADGLCSWPPEMTSRPLPSPNGPGQGRLF